MGQSAARRAGGANLDSTKASAVRDAAAGSVQPNTPPPPSAPSSPPRLTDRLGSLLMRLQRGQLCGASKAALALHHPRRQPLPRQRAVHEHNKAVGAAADALRAAGWVGQEQRAWAGCPRTARRCPDPGKRHAGSRLTSPPNARSLHVSSMTSPVAGRPLAAAAAAAVPRNSGAPCAALDSCRVRRGLCGLLDAARRRCHRSSRTP